MNTIFLRFFLLDALLFIHDLNTVFIAFTSTVSEEVTSSESSSKTTIITNAIWKMNNVILYLT